MAPNANNNFSGLARRAKRSRAVTVLYTLIVLPTLAMIVSLAVDFGRVEWCRTQLLDAADSASRAAATQLNPGSNGPADFSAASTAANAMLALNKVDGGTVTARATVTITYGSWSGTTFTAGSTSGANAAKISLTYAVPTLWAAVLGSRTCTVDVSTISIITLGTSSYGVVGIGGMTLNTAVVVDSYSAASGSYSLTKGSNGSVASSGNWNINGGFTVKGNLYYTGSAPTNGTVTGSRTALPASPTLASLYPAATVPGGAISEGNYNGGSLLLTAGNYYYTNFSQNAGDTLTVSGGVVKIYVNGNINLNGTVNSLGLPSDCLIYNVSGSGINIGGSGQIYAQLYGPSSPVNFNTSGDVYGSIVGSQISTGGTGRIHVDTSGLGSSGDNITQVK